VIVDAPSQFVGISTGSYAFEGRGFSPDVSGCFCLRLQPLKLQGLKAHFKTPSVFDLKVETPNPPKKAVAVSFFASEE
jgi:hypothetical protein